MKASVACRQRPPLISETSPVRTNLPCPRRTSASLLALLWLLLCGCTPVFAQAPAGAGQDQSAQSVDSPATTTGLPPDAIEPVERLAKSIAGAEKAIKQIKELEGELARLREEVERIIYDSTATADNLRPQLAELKKQIQRLGPPPAKDHPPEPPAVAAERKRLNDLTSQLDGAIKTTELAWMRAKQLIDRITVIRYQMFARNLFERRDSPLLPGVWHEVVDRMDLVQGRIAYYGGDWLTWAGRVGNWLAGLGLGVLAIFGLGTLWVRRHTSVALARPESSPDFFHRVARAAWIAPLRMLPAAAAVIALYLGLAQLDLLFSPWIRLAQTTLSGLLVYIISSSLLAVALQPAHPAWRLIPVADGTARRLLWILRAYVAIYVLDVILVELGRAIYVPLAVTVAHTALTCLAYALLLLALFFTPLAPQVGPDRPVNGHPFVPPPVHLFTPAWLKVPVLVLAAAILTATALGYIALAQFFAHQVVLSGTVLAAAGLLYLAVRAMTRGRADNKDIIGGFVERRFGLVDPIRRRQISRLVEVTLVLAVLMLAVPAILLQWGFSTADVRDWAKSLFFGFEIGQFRISLVRILVGLGLFTILLLLTRLVQRWLREKVLVQPRVDQGIANSVETAVGYAGIALALLIALSWAGLDITSLAIVAGALSVGIGFGLQSIVNNFVSGLILLVERPVKVGDWIVVGSEQGNVRKISVRSTEIETFDKASLIVPNSELITGRVLNWTHRNPLGRAVVKVRVAPNADPQAVLAILRECAESHPDVLKANPPFVTFDDFSGTGLEFTVRAVVGDVYAANRVATDLRVELLGRLRAAGIQLSNPQYDIHLKDLDWVKSTAQRLAQQRTGGPPGDAE